MDSRQYHMTNIKGAKKFRLEKDRPSNDPHLFVSLLSRRDLNNMPLQIKGTRQLSENYKDRF